MLEFFFSFSEFCNRMYIYIKSVAIFDGHSGFLFFFNYNFTRVVFTPLFRQIKTWWSSAIVYLWICKHCISYNRVVVVYESRYYLKITVLRTSLHPYTLKIGVTKPYVYTFGASTFTTHFLSFLFSITFEIQRDSAREFEREDRIQDAWMWERNMTHKFVIILTVIASLS